MDELTFTDSFMPNAVKCCIHRVWKKVPLYFCLWLTLPNANWFSKFFHRYTQQ